MKSKKEINKLIKGLISGNHLALSKVISIVENHPEEIPFIMDAIYHSIGKSHLIGFTGPPGSGKSTIIDGLTRILREKNFSVGILAVDPSSPFTGGAVLGDRIRMQKHSTDKHVFIRSIGSRGSHGGLSRSTGRILDLFDAAGFDYTIIETVGVGQTELDIMKFADTTIVILVPESGDSIQTMKAGLMEIADIFVVNKSDRTGADDTLRYIQNMVEMKGKPSGWRQPAVLTNALNDSGIDKLLTVIEKHNKYLSQTRGKRAELREAELKDILVSEFAFKVEALLKTEKFKKYIKLTESGKESPYSIARKILSRLLKIS